MSRRPEYTVCAGAGSYADYTASKKEWLGKVTDKFPIEIGGGVPLVSLTALQVGHLAASLVIAISARYSLVTHRDATTVHATDHRLDTSFSSAVQPGEHFLMPLSPTKAKSRNHEGSMCCWSAAQALEFGGAPKPGRAC